MSDTSTGTAAGKDLTYGHDTHESHAFEPPDRIEKSEEKTKPGELGDETIRRVRVEAGTPASSPSAGGQSTKIGFTRNGNPNLGAARTRQSEWNRPSTPIASPNTMSEGAIGKLQQKDFTPEVDELLPQATVLAQVGSPLYCSEL